MGNGVSGKAEIVINKKYANDFIDLFDNDKDSKKLYPTILDGFDMKIFDDDYILLSIRVTTVWSFEYWMKYYLKDERRISIDDVIDLMDVKRINLIAKDTCNGFRERILYDRIDKISLRYESQDIWE